MDLDELAYVGPEVWLLGTLAAVICSVLVATVWTAWQLPRVQKVRRTSKLILPRFPLPSDCLTLTQGTVAFFHPFADGGGGGERVLW